MKCNRCLNTDPRLFVFDQGIYYCRKCISFGRLNVGEYDRIPKLKKRIIETTPLLEFALTPDQERASKEALSILKRHQDIFLFAAAGAGKTEITYPSICFYLSQGKKVGFAISRRQVVLEIGERLKKAFPSLKITVVCQGYTDELDGDLIVCTMHQLYRYPQTFDLLILDELDAFPYANDQLLHQLVENSCIGEKLCLSATIDPALQKKIDRKEIEVVSLFKRPHYKPLIVPKVVRLPVIFQYGYAIGSALKFKTRHKQVLLFVPRKKDTYYLKWIMKIWKAESIHALDPNKDEKMKDFREKKINILITTTLLERGITVDSVQVIVLKADHPVFSSASLVQIFGRIGRKFTDPYGEGICLCQFKNESIRSCIELIEKMNRSA